MSWTRAQLLYFAGNVGDGAGLFVSRSRRQNDVGMLRGFGQEQILHDNERLGGSECCRASGLAPTTHSASSSGRPASHRSYSRLARTVVAGKQFRKQAHIDGPARIRVVHQADSISPECQRIAEGDQTSRTGQPFDGILEQNHQFGFGGELFAQFQRVEFLPTRARLRVVVFADGPGASDINIRVVVATIGANLKGEQRMLLRKIAPMTRTAFVVYKSSMVASVPVVRSKHRAA